MKPETRVPPFGSYGWGWYGYSYEYKSAATVAGWPLLHVCGGADPATLQPRVARGVIAIGNIAVGVLAIGGVASGLLAVGGVSLGVLLAIGGAAAGAGLSIGGVAIGSIAVAGVAVGFYHAIGGMGFGPSVVDGLRCDTSAGEFVRQWTGGVPKACR